MKRSTLDDTEVMWRGFNAAMEACAKVIALYPEVGSKVLAELDRQLAAAVTNEDVDAVNFIGFARGMFRVAYNNHLATGED